MQEAPLKQIHDLIQRSKSILIVLPYNPSTDAVSAGLAMYLALEKLEKNIRVVSNEFELPVHHQFLPKSKDIHQDLSALRKFVITLDVSRTKVEELSYDILGDKLNVFITPKNGFFETRDVTTSASAYEYDLIIVVDAPDLESLGKLYEDNAEFFYHTPLVNIDHSPTNEQYGQINYIDLVATSTSEMVFELIKQLGANLMDEYIATSLLTGIISKTKGFQSGSVTPRSLSIASHLIEQGARRDEIIKNLYRTKSLSTLKLWGRALARLRTEVDGRIVWSVLRRQDFERSGTDEKELDGIIDELIINTPHAEAMILMYERAEGGVGVIANTVRALDGRIMFKSFSPTGTRNYTTFALLGTDSATVETQVVEAAKHYLASF
ncbi:MAG: Exopolyphosphatase-related protein [Parcubacteria group bacterium GW2011_GWC2_49_9]|nr:MAG: Exopolyphosphatase-related protein [Parcubacteria group bacterium GW2011_GWA2_48_9]KKW16690.1 MAG: Exopolyphosphatase-related protein [Parcubacteria group bacterium GW2011_GWC2_49_9]